MKNKVKLWVFSLNLVLALCCISCGGGGGGNGTSTSQGSPPESQPPPSQTTENVKIYGLNFSPYVDGQDPNQGSSVSEQQIRDRLRIIAPYTEWIRTFGSTQGLEHTGRIAREFNLKTALGAWLGRDLQANERELNNLIAAARDGNADVAIVGSEVLLRGDLTLTQLLNYIDRFKQAVPSVPITTAEVYDNWITQPDLVQACDVLLVNYYPYWEGKDVKEAIANIHSLHQRVISRAGGKEVIVSESGWPSGGNSIGQAIPTLDNACFYFKNFISWAKAEGVKYSYFEAYDESWKAAYEGPQGAYWGVWDKEGVLKPCMQDVFEGQTIPDNWSFQGLPGGPGTPSIEFTSVPPRGSSEDLKGQVWHALPIEYAVVVYIKVGGGWWTKPYWNNPLASIKYDGSWTCDITTGGVDEQATNIAAYLVPATYNPPLASGETSLPIEFEQKSVAKVNVSR